MIGGHARTSRLFLVRALLATGVLATCCMCGGRGCASDPPPECWSHDDCPKGLRCDLHPVPDAPPNQCVDRTSRIGFPCDPESCAQCICSTEVACIEDGPYAGTFSCQLDCTSDDDCPEGFVCTITDDGILDYCVPAADGGPLPG